ncbi:MAG: flagellar biosynthetic protein FliP [Candidatus Endobugula sp.]|jgi:flagellar biosynthetic protein FliP
MINSPTVESFLYLLSSVFKYRVKTTILLLFLILFCSVFSMPVFAQDTSATNNTTSSINKTMGGFPDLSAITLTTNDDGSQEYSISIQVLLLMTTLTFIPAILLMMTSFTRIIIVFAILRQALGLQQSPSNQILIGMTLFLTLFIMTPVINEVNENALQPYLAEQISSDQAIDNVIGPFHRFMMGQTRESDLKLFMDIADVSAVDTADQVPLRVLIPSFITSELKTAFQIGFILFIPFLVIDLVVASVLMAMGMMMLSPLIISLPFKLMLFVLVDGWAMLMGTLATSFGI